MSIALIRWGADPCAAFGCGDDGRCLAVNLPPTCVCDQGRVAVGQSSGADRVTTCQLPLDPMARSFCAGRLPELPQEQPGGRQLEFPPRAPDTPRAGSVPAHQPPRFGGGAALELLADPAR